MKIARRSQRARDRSPNIRAVFRSRQRSTPRRHEPPWRRAPAHSRACPRQRRQRIAAPDDVSRTLTAIRAPARAFRSASAPATGLFRTCASGLPSSIRGRCCPISCRSTFTKQALDPSCESARQRHWCRSRHLECAGQTRAGPKWTCGELPAHSARTGRSILQCAHQSSANRIDAQRRRPAAAAARPRSLRLDVCRARCRTGIRHAHRIRRHAEAARWHASDEQCRPDDCRAANHSKVEDATIRR